MSEEAKEKKEAKPAGKPEKKQSPEKGAEAKEAKKEKAPKEGAAAKPEAGAVEGDAAAAGTEQKAEATPKKRKKGRKNIPVGVVHIQSTFNNTIITFSDNAGNTVSWATSGSSGFKGSRKSTPFAAQVAAEQVAAKAMDAGMRSVTVELSGPGSGRESAVRAIQKSGIKITAIKDVTPIPHNGCRPPKRRRV